jgi:hypothetical protein
LAIVQFVAVIPRLGNVHGSCIGFPRCCFWLSAATIAGATTSTGLSNEGEDDLEFPPRFVPLHRGLPGRRWLGALINRIDPALFSECFRLQGARPAPEAPELVAIDGNVAP